MKRKKKQKFEKLKCRNVEKSSEILKRIAQIWKSAEILEKKCKKSGTARKGREEIWMEKEE